ncbi:MAG: hypothetical protein U5K72_10625 [Balneolaceae bacterium]|nr:hypothetical protein [Balneolaceae bacterium]
MEWYQAFSDWFFSLSENYGVNPFIFGGIYIGAIPFFTISVAWIVRNYKRGTSIVLPVMSASFCFVSAYLYLMIAGENVPSWVYLIVIGLLIYGAWSTFKKVKSQVKEENLE